MVNNTQKLSLDSFFQLFPSFCLQPPPQFLVLPTWLGQFIPINEVSQNNIWSVKQMSTVMTCFGGKPVYYVLYMNQTSMCILDINCVALLITALRIFVTWRLLHVCTLVNLHNKDSKVVFYSPSPSVSLPPLGLPCWACTVLYLSAGPVPDEASQKVLPFWPMFMLVKNRPLPSVWAEGGYEVNKYNMKINKNPVQTNHLPQ